mmetsp:Transcript_88394/g.249075  ORF Transcript_88394/g.249075 Transcript_88394/m.249075 type:complete len:105 (+) Transcript_88394:945-1259(+)
MRQSSDVALFHDCDSCERASAQMTALWLEASGITTWRGISSRSNVAQLHEEPLSQEWMAALKQTTSILDLEFNACDMSHNACCQRAPREHALIAVQCRTASVST